MKAETIRLLAVMASPRANGNSAWIIHELLEDTGRDIPVKSTVYSMSGKRISPCTGCLGCYKNGGDCVIRDDFQELKSLWVSNDAILYVMPVYHLGVPGQLKCFFDRLGNTFHGQPPQKHRKVIGAIAQGGISMGGQELTNLYLMSHALIMHSFFVIGDRAQLGIGLVSGVGGNRDSFREKSVSGETGYVRDLEISRNMLRRLVETTAIIRAGISLVCETQEEDEKEVRE
ncbi:flavodoxin family protein [Synergistaceae bacterium OttesenSCG-928-I11]|nr:flavodoxin family protein [Synergistaceae bacterium OttesenSCG-928-I11]